MAALMAAQPQPDPSHAARQRASVEESLFKRTPLNLAIGDSSQSPATTGQVGPPWAASSRVTATTWTQRHGRHALLRLISCRMRRRFLVIDHRAEIMAGLAPEFVAGLFCRASVKANSVSLRGLQFGLPVCQAPPHSPWLCGSHDKTKGRNGSDQSGFWPEHFRCKSCGGFIDGRDLTWDHEGPTGS
jgi:hypothetical protein